MRIVITGAHGQVGRALAQTTPKGMEVAALSRQDLDITDTDAVDQKIGSLSPDWIINAAAYTAVDQAEEEPARAAAVNATGAGNIARAAATSSARLVHISTDFVFDGHKGTAYAPGDSVEPRGAYARSKTLGERQVETELDGQALILRTAWVYSRHGRNFVNTMLRLMRERDALPIVVDQVGTPTQATGLAKAIWRAVEISLTGYHHWTDSGVASWYDFAQAISEQALALGLLERPAALEPIPSREFPTAAPRPPFSVLDKNATWSALGYKAPHWRQALHDTLREIAQQEDD